MIGVTVHGWLEAFFILDSDIPQDSNCESTIIARCLDIMADIAQDRGVAMPQNLQIQPDSTAREAKKTTLPHVQRVPVR